MSDHLNYCNTIADSPDEISTDDYDEPVFVNIEEKNGDEFLIELYRERPFLYDKNNSNFKDCLMKQNAWIEISEIMTQTNGNIYTPSYCQRRCISLREQYNRQKKKVETESKNGNAVAKDTRFPFFSQLAFLDHVIKRRRRRYTNCMKSRPSIVDIEDNIYESQSNETSNEANDTPKMKKRKVNKTLELEQTLIQMSDRILNYMEKKVTSVDDAFMEFIKIQFNSIPEKEKNIRRKMIMDALTEPLPKK